MQWSVGFEDASGCEEASASHGPTIRAAPVHSTSSNKADSADSTPTLLTDVPASFSKHPNRWCVKGQYRVYRDAKLLNDKGS